MYKSMKYSLTRASAIILDYFFIATTEKLFFFNPESIHKWALRRPQPSQSVAFQCETEVHL